MLSKIMETIIKEIKDLYQQTKLLQHKHALGNIRYALKNSLLPKAKEQDELMNEMSYWLNIILNNYELTMMDFKDINEILQKYKQWSEG